MKSTNKKIKLNKTKPKKITYGAVSLPDDAFNPKETKFRVTMYLDLDVLDEVRKLAKEKGLPYQTYINQHLRDTILGTAMDDKIRSIVRQELAKTGTD
jgi:predicted DNA binding CopG/RHH family protein